MTATNEAWTEESGYWHSTITAASMGGQKVLFDPWMRAIPNSSLTPIWDTVDCGDCGPEIIAWSVTVVMDGVKNLYLKNV